MKNKNLIIIILSIIMLALILLIKYTYKTNLTQRTFLIQIYFYITLSLITMFLITKFIQVKTNNFIMVILFFIISIISLSLIYNDTMIINHTGLFLFILNNAFFLNVFFNDNDNVNTSILITTGIFIILTLITTFLSNETLIKLQKLLPPFMILLCLVIIIQIVLIMCCSNAKYFKYFTRGSTLLSVITVFIFIVFTLIDTSQVLLVNIAGTHYDQNYPKLSIQLILDYINLLLNIDNITK